jgi:hypothetical protein
VLTHVYEVALTLRVEYVHLRQRPDSAFSSAGSARTAPSTSGSHGPAGPAVQGADPDEQRPPVLAAAATTAPRAAFFLRSPQRLRHLRIQGQNTMRMIAPLLLHRPLGRRSSRARSDRTLGSLRWVERCCPSVAQARRWDTASTDRTWPMQARRRAKLKKLSSAAALRISLSTVRSHTPAADGHSPAQAPANAGLGHPSSHQTPAATGSRSPPCAQRSPTCFS